MDYLAKTVANILDRLFAIKDDALMALNDIDGATEAEFRTVIELCDLSRELFNVLNDEEGDVDEDGDAEDEP